MVRLEILSKLKKKFNDLIRTRTRDLPVCRIAHQPSMLQRAPDMHTINSIAYNNSVDGNFRAYQEVLTACSVSDL
jgi:hypothetical protein